MCCILVVNQFTTVNSNFLGLLYTNCPGVVNYLPGFCRPNPFPCLPIRRRAKPALDCSIDRRSWPIVRPIGLRLTGTTNRPSLGGTESVPPPPIWWYQIRTTSPHLVVPNPYHRWYQIRTTNRFLDMEKTLVGQGFLRFDKKYPLLHITIVLLNILITNSKIR